MSGSARFGVQGLGTLGKISDRSSEPSESESRSLRDGQAQDELIDAIRGELRKSRFYFLRGAVGSVAPVRCLRYDTVSRLMCTVGPRGRMPVASVRGTLLGEFEMEVSGAFPAFVLGTEFRRASRPFADFSRDRRVRLSSRL